MPALYPTDVNATAVPPPASVGVPTTVQLIVDGHAGHAAAIELLEAIDVLEGCEALDGSEVLDGSDVLDG